MGAVNDIYDQLPFGRGKQSGELLPLVYDELRHMASRRMAGMDSGSTLQPTALVHEAWLQVGVDANRFWADREHFVRTAARVMRDILVDRARKRTALKRGSGIKNLRIEDFEIIEAQPEERVLMIDEALIRLESIDPECAKVVSLKFFGGLTNRQIADLTGVAERTIERKWAYARSNLYDIMREEGL